jgi:hypothetical protein
MAWIERRRWLCALLITILIIGAIIGFVFTWVSTNGPERLGIDYRQYAAATERYLSGASFYQPWQLVGTYEISTDAVTDINTIPVLYPPTTLILLIPGMLLPAAVWWTVPIAFLTWHVWECKPRLAAWILIVLLLSYQNTIWLIASGNPVMWIAAAVAAGTRWHWPAVFALLKPTLAPFALIGIRHRSWWVAALALVVISLLFLSLWDDYITAVMNARDGRSGLLYSIGDVPLMLIPLVAWAGRRRAGRSAASVASHGDKTVAA